MKKLIMFLLLAAGLCPLDVATAVADDERTAAGDLPPCTAELFLQITQVTRCTWTEKKVRLFMIPAPEGAKDRVPLLYLLGGPGGRGEVHVKHMELMARRLARPVLMPDPADSYPAFDCRRTDLDDAHWGIAAKPEDAVFYTRPLQQRRLESCLAQIKISQNQLKAISTQSQAVDLEALRELLKINQWVVMAESYGARVALALSSINPAAIESLILDSPETPWVEAFWHTGRNFHAALQRLSELCRDQYLCPAMRLHLEDRIPALISLFERDQVEPLALRNLYSRKVVAYARPTREQLLIITFMALRSPQRGELMPYIAASSSDETLKKRYGLLLSELLVPSGSLNMGVHHAIRCSELPLGQWYDALASDIRSYPAVTPLLDYLDWRQKFVCQALGISSPAGFERPVLPGTVPTLVLSGGLDPVTPLPVVQEAFDGTSARYLTYPTLGHIIHSQHDCVLQDVATFAADGDLAETSCSRRDLELKFYTPVMKR